MELDPDLLEAVVVKALREVKQNGAIMLDADYYWDIPAESVHNVYEPPANFTIGQLSEDYLMIANALEGGFTVRQNLKKVAALLRYIAER